MGNTTTFRTYFTPMMLRLMVLGCFSGLPLALTASTMSAWLKDAGVDIKTIGLFAAVAVPYSLKFLWSPLVDAMPLPVLHNMLGRRRSWMVLSQLGLAVVMALMAFANPALDAGWLALLAVALAVCSASQDIVLDAYRVEAVPQQHLGHAVAMFTLGYRIGMLVSGAGALVLADMYGWQTTYLVMAALMISALLITLTAPEPQAAKRKATKKHTALLARWQAWIADAVIAPFHDFMQRSGWLWMVIFIASYKLGDAVLGVMTNPFLLEIGFTKTQIASVVKLYGFGATIAGTFVGGWVAQKYKLFWPLIACGFLHALTNLMFVVQAKVGADMTVLTLGITMENFTGGISSALLVVFISMLCNKQFTATQYALLSSLATVGRTMVSSGAGFVVAATGWEVFFIIAVLLALPSLVLLWYIRRYIPK